MQIYSKKILLKSILMLSALLVTILFASYKLNADIKINCEPSGKSISGRAQMETLFYKTVDTDIDVNDFRFQISKTGGYFPSVVYNSTNSEYMIIWVSQINADGQPEIFGQRLDAKTGEELGKNDFRISDDSTDSDQRKNRRIYPSLSYNPTNNEYLVVWVDKDVGNKEFEIFGQRLDGTTGEALGDNDFRISDIGSNGNPQFNNAAPSVAYNSINNEYLVVWAGDDIRGEFEIYGQRIDGTTGKELGADDFRISDMGCRRIRVRPFDALNPSVVYNSTNNEYLVVWTGNEKLGRLHLPLSPIAIPLYEIFGQRIDGATGQELGEDDFLIGQADGKASLTILRPSVSYNSRNNEYLVAFDGEDIGFVGLGHANFSASSLAGRSFHRFVGSAGIFGQRIDGTTGNKLRPNDFRINSSGDGLINASMAYNSQENEYLVIWRRLKSGTFIDDKGGKTPFVDVDLFGQRINAVTGKMIDTEDFKLADDFRDTISSVAYNTKDNEYLIVWASRTNTEGVEISDQKTEIFGRRFKP